MIAGSTRLKAGTATKMVLNMLTTVAMIKVGKTYGNLMVDVQTGSEKLKDRARRILNMVTGHRLRRGGRTAQAAKWNVKAAIVMQKAGLSLPQALRRLKKADDSVREAIGEDVEPRLREELAELASPLRRSSGAARPRPARRRRRVELQERRGQRGGDRAVQQRSTHGAFDRPVATGRSPRLKDRRHPHRQRLASARLRIPAEKSGVAAPRFVGA